MKKKQYIKKSSVKKSRIIKSRGKKSIKRYRKTKQKGKGYSDLEEKFIALDKRDDNIKKLQDEIDRIDVKLSLKKTPFEDRMLLKKKKEDIETKQKYLYMRNPYSLSFVDEVIRSDAYRKAIEQGLSEKEAVKLGTEETSKLIDNIKSKISASKSKKIESSVTPRVTKSRAL